MNIYNGIKSVAKTFIPRKILFKYEDSIRYLYSLKYTGNRYQCNICNKKLSAFINLENGDRLCPRCGSLQRTRRLWKVLDADFQNKEFKILDFSPSRSFYRLMKKQFVNYTSSDLSGDFIADVSFDITNIHTPDENFDLIICYHVLEHIEHDNLAMNELYRVLKKGGHAIIQTPFKEGDIYENASITLPEDREKHFGQSDHVRVYAVNGLMERLQKAGFEVEVKNFEETSENIHGLNTKETLLMCRKKQDHTS